MKTRTMKILCLSSKTINDKHIIIWDFDNIELYDVLKSLGKVQKYNKLSDIFVFSSKNGYNALCLNELHIKEVYNILINTRFNDYNHTKIGNKMGSWCWRIGDDKNFIKQILPCNDCNGFTQSLGHKLFLKENYGINSFQGEFNNNPELLFESYTQDVI